MIAILLRYNLYLCRKTWFRVISHFLHLWLVLHLWVIQPGTSQINQRLREDLMFSKKKLSVWSRKARCIGSAKRISTAISRYPSSKLYSFDESSVIKMMGNRKYGNARVSERAIELQSYASNTTFTINLLHSVVGVDYFNILQGPSNGLELLNFFSQCLTSRMGQWKCCPRAWQRCSDGQLWISPCPSHWAIVAKYAQYIQNWVDLPTTVLPTPEYMWLLFQSHQTISSTAPVVSNELNGSGNWRVSWKTRIEDQGFIIYFCFFLLFEKFMVWQAISYSRRTRVKSSFYPLCEYVSEDKDSVDRKEPIYTSLILSTLGLFTVGGKDKRRFRGISVLVHLLRWPRLSLNHKMSSLLRKINNTIFFIDAFVTWQRPDSTELRNHT